jgi:hypothetical protein
VSSQGSGGKIRESAGREAHWLRRSAQAAALLVIGWSVLLQFVLAPAHAAPWIVFTVVLLAWALAVVLLAWRAAVGGIYELLLGAASVLGIFQSHGDPFAPTNLALALVSAIAAVAGLLSAIPPLRGGRRATFR